QTDVLERAADASGGDRVRRLAGDLGAVEDDVPGRRLVDAGEHVEEGRLAGPVRPDQAHDRLLGHGELDVVHGDEAAELLPNAGCGEQVGHQAWWSTSGSSATPCSNSALRRASGISPCGRNSMTISRMTP